MLKMSQKLLKFFFFLIFIEKYLLFPQNHKSAKICKFHDDK